MTRRSPKLSQLPMNALRAFDAAARNLSFTKAGLELRVTQAAVSQHVKSLEDALGVRLFRRLPRGLSLTEEGEALLPAISDAFGRINHILERFENGRLREMLSVGVVGTFASGWLVPRLRAFTRSQPHIDLRVFVNNNRVDLAGEGLDYAIRFGDGAWHGAHAAPLLVALFTPMCASDVAKRLRSPVDLQREVLLRSYRPGEWGQWFDAAGYKQPRMSGPIFDSSIGIAHAAAQGGGVALLPIALFSEDLARKRLVRPFRTEVHLGSYWLTWLKSKRATPAMQAFREWLLNETQEGAAFQANGSGQSGAAQR